MGYPSQGDGETLDEAASFNQEQFPETAHSEATLATHPLPENMFLGPERVSVSGTAVSTAVCGFPKGEDKVIMQPHK